MQVAGESVTATGNHPFFVVSGEDLFSRPVPEELAHEPATTTAYSLFGRWVEARDLRVGDRLLGPEGDSLPISALASETKTLVVYNLNVVSPDTYLISSIGLVVHNADKCGADAPKGGEGRRQKGERMTDADSTMDQLDGVTKAQEASRKNRPSVMDEGEWEGSKKRPKARDIESTKKSQQRAKNKGYDADEQ